MNKDEWVQAVKKTMDGYLNRNDGCFDSEMHAKLAGYDFAENGGEQNISIEFETLKWQINERGGIHGGAIAGMFDTAFGVVANFIAGEGEAATADMNISFLRPVEYGEHTIVKVYIVKKGRTMIRLRAEMFCKESGKLVATGVGSWIPL
ncbi:MAG: PaaI family thioesterase [Firmicutes bacterium]|nr:PaaI family thioesterase [Bacillota bacterium]